MNKMYRHWGAAPYFPYLDERRRFRFPNPQAALHDIVAIGGNLSPGMLLSAYENGIFPWYNEDEPVIWQSPDPRFVLYPDNLHISKTMQKVMRQERFEIRYDTAFESVITACASVPRPGQHGTWINSDIISAYCEMHKLGYARCAEAWRDGHLAGACYGILLPPVFFGESMFAHEDNASKAAFLTYAQMLFDSGIRLIDCQVYTAHLAALGAVEIPRVEFLTLLKQFYPQAV
jgi:leucyl/phenylalanyl-tRNA--protein transferase